LPDDNLTIGGVAREALFLGKGNGRQEQMHHRYAPSGTPDEWSLADKLLSFF
jgi:hypothetical protein